MWVADSRVWSQSRPTLTQKEEQVNYSKPLEYDLPQWVVNRKKDLKDGSYTQQVANGWDTKIREDLEKMKKLNYIKVLDITSDLKSEDNIPIPPEEEEKLSGFRELKLNKTK